MSDKINILEIVRHKDRPIDFASLDHADFKESVLFLIGEVRAALKKVIENKEAPDWENLIDPLDDAEENLSLVWGVVSLLNTVVDTPQLRATVNELLVPLSDLHSEIGQNEELYEKFKALKNSQKYEALSTARKRILEKSIRDFVLSGAELSKPNKEKLAGYERESSELSQKFSENLLDCTNEYALYFPADTEELKGIPQEDLALFAQQAASEKAQGYKITLHMPNYLPVMQYAESGALREKLYHAYVTRASEFSPAGKDNLPIINKLLELRVKSAKLLGFKNFSELSLVPKMADSPEEVVSFLRNLAQKAKPAAEKDMADLLAYGRDALGIKNPHPWDYSFISEKLREAKFAYSEQEVKQYFTEGAVLKGMFSLVEKMFSIRIKEKQVPVWHKDVKYYIITDEKGSEIASFYTDLYARNGKRGGAWMGDLKSRRLVGGRLQLPLAYLVCNFAAPVGDSPSLLTLSDVETIFHEFGHGLHHMMTRQTDLSASGINGVEWDAVELPSQFMENFVLDWDVMCTITSHVRSGEKMPRALFDKIVAAKNFQAGMSNVRQIEFALFDMLLHMDEHPRADTVKKLLKEIREEVAVVFPPEYHRFAESFSHIFAGGYAAGYYSYKWAEVLSADAFSMFKEEGIFSPLAGQKWLNEVLAAGSSRPAIENFIAFRGRRPEANALLRQYGLIGDEPDDKASGK